jgi:hypothetical protein
LYTTGAGCHLGGLNNRLQFLLADASLGIPADGAMSVQQTDGFIHVVILLFIDGPAPATIRLIGLT